MKFQTFVLIALLVFTAVWMPAARANPVPEATLTEIGPDGVWLELEVWDHNFQDYASIRIDDVDLLWDECDIEYFGSYILVYPWLPLPSPEGGVLQVFIHGYLAQEVAFGYAGNFPELPFDGSLMIVRLGYPSYDEYWTVGCGFTTPGEDNPILPPPAETLPPFVINEIYLPPGDVNQRFVEIYNPTNESVDISGWSLYINNCSMFSGVTELLPYEFRIFTVSTQSRLRDLNRGWDQLGLIGPDSTYYFTIRWTAPLDSGYSWSLFSDGNVSEVGETPYNLSSFYNARPFTPGEPNAPLSPAPFQLLLPTDGDTCWALDPLLVWQPALNFDPGDSVSYEVWLDTLSDLSTAWEVTSGLETESYSLENVFDDHAYYWTVHASDVNTDGTWADDTLMFRTYLPEPPESFCLVTPEDRDTVYTMTPTLHWHKASDPDPNDEVCYRLLWSYAADFSVYEDTTLCDTSFTFPINLLFSGSFWNPTRASRYKEGLSEGFDEVEDDSTVYWKVQAVDRFGLTTWCEPEEGWSFLVYIEQPPNGFDLISPINGDTLDTLRAQFVWATAFDPDPEDSISLYRIYLTLDSTFSTNLDSQDVGETELIWDGLEDDQTYWWRVKAFDIHENETFSNQAWNFHICLCEVPLSFSLLEPENGAEIPDGEINFCWQAARDPDPDDEIRYTLWLGEVDNGQIIATYNAGSDTCFLLSELPPPPYQPAPIEWWVTAHSNCPDTIMESLEHFIFYPTSNTPGRDEDLPDHFSLAQNYPNPFNASTTLMFTVPEPSNVRISVFDIEGRKVATLAEGRYVPGFHRVNWNGSNYASNVYFIVMQAPSFRTVKKALLLK